MSEQPTLRALMQSIRDRHGVYNPEDPPVDHLCDGCNSWHPCADYSDAVAALALIDEGDVAWLFYGNLGTCTADKLPQLAALNGSEIVGRVIPDPLSCPEVPAAPHAESVDPSMYGVVRNSKSVSGYSPAPAGHPNWKRPEVPAETRDGETT